jgi:two-component system cell cycle sensor histidine kinase/response regulator CckA
MDAVGRLRRGHGARLQQPLTSSPQRPPPRGLPAATAARPGDVDEIQAAVDRATGLTRQLLAFSRQQAARPEPLDLNAWSPGWPGSLAPADRRPGDDPHGAGGPTVRVKADRGHLEQVLMNLAVNARDAMPDGGTLTVSTAAAERATRAARPARVARLTVADTRCGLTAE